MDAALYILCGGRSSRFGRDKGLFCWRGKPLFLRAAEQFGGLFSARRVFVVDSEEKNYAQLGFSLVRDLREGKLGPLAGLEAAAAHAAGRFPLFFVTSCDRLGLRESWLLELAGALERTGALAAAFFEKYWQPFPSAFRPEAGKWAARLLDRGQTRPAALFDRLAINLPPPPGWENVRDINRPEQLAQIG